MYCPFNNDNYCVRYRCPFSMGEYEDCALAKAVKLYVKKDNQQKKDYQTELLNQQNSLDSLQQISSYINAKTGEPIDCLDGLKPLFSIQGMDGAFTESVGNEYLIKGE